MTESSKTETRELQILALQGCLDVYPRCMDDDNNRNNCNVISLSYTQIIFSFFENHFLQLSEKPLELCINPVALESCTQISVPKCVISVSLNPHNADHYWNQSK